MPIFGAQLCGARCRTKAGAPCSQPGMKNGRCRMHGGVFYKRETRGAMSLRSIEERKKERVFLRAMKSISRKILEVESE